MVVDTWESLTIIGWAWNTNYSLIFYIIIIYYIFISLYFQILYQLKLYWQLIFFETAQTIHHIDTFIKLHTWCYTQDWDCLNTKNIFTFICLRSQLLIHLLEQIKVWVTKIKKVMKRGGPRYKLLQL